MPIQPTYPGVYVEEIPSGVRSITGVATSITAFIGRALRGPTDKPVTINNFGDYERQFGGLWANSMMSYSVRDYYQNGGSRAVIVRVVNGATPAIIELPTTAGGGGAGTPLTLEAKSPGVWGKNLSASVNHKTNDSANSNLFNLTIREKDGATETFLNVSVNPADPRYVVRVLKETSALMHVPLQADGSAPVLETRPNETISTIILPAPAGARTLVLNAVNRASREAKITASVNHTGIPVGDTKLFNLIIAVEGGTQETFADLSIDPANVANYVVTRLQTSAFVRVQGNVPTTRPDETPNAVKSVPFPTVDAVDETLRHATAPVTITIPVTGAGATNLILDVLSTVELGSKITAAVAAATDADAAHFNLAVSKAANGAVAQVDELFENLSSDDPGALRTALETSKLVRLSGTPSARPADVAAIKSVPEATLPPVPPLADDGIDLTNAQYLGNENRKEGMYALLGADFNLLCIPPAKRADTTAPAVYSPALALCVRKRAMLIVDPPADWGVSADHALATAESTLDTLGLAGSDARNAALYFPRINQADPLLDGQTQTFVPSGMVAGVMARTDTSRGVWKSPAGLDASLNGIQGLQVNLTDDENGVLNPLGINCLRQFPVNGRVVWGARTLRGADQLADTDNKYVAVRRMSLFIEESLYRGTQWVVFEPNDEPLWAQIRLNIGAFMQNLFRQGAFQGKTPREAYLVKCDRETTNQTDINQGVVNILVGFAPLKPAEFVFIKLQQLSGQIDI